jgi:glucose/arabinose dehydrogenase
MTGILCRPRTLFLALALIFSVPEKSFSGPLQRVPNTTLSMPAAPPTFGFTWTNALGSLTFSNPVCIASPPGETNRLFVIEKAGRVIVITNLASPTRTVFMDITPQVTTAPAFSDERGLLGLEFHPGFATNGYFFLWYTGPAVTGSNSGMHDILARFQVSAANTNQGNTNSRVVLFAQYDREVNHNAGDLHFGPDGYLYVSLGDEGGGDGILTSGAPSGNPQRIDNNFFSGILRIDVDKRPGNLLPNHHVGLLGQTNYLVPADNPFVGVTSFNGLTVNSNNVRTEFWAVGLRNPWRYSFDIDGTLYCGDVGQEDREEIDLIVKGGNYGWNYWEGFLQRTNNAQIPPGFVHSPPLMDYQRTTVYTAIIGGRVYRGQRFSQLYGSYIYADSESGNIWSLRYAGTNVTQNTLLFTSDLNTQQRSGISTFGVDPSNNDLLYATEHNGPDGTVRRFVYNSTTNGSPIPTLLSGTGVFTNLTTLAVAPGIVPYDINVPFWSDNAIKTRWFSVPKTNLNIGFDPANNWSFPTGTVWIKHFGLQLTNGDPNSIIRLETRLIVKNSNGVYGVSYRWGGSTNDAALVPEGGTNETFVINDGGGILRTQVWHYPSRVECLQCHTTAGGYGLGFTTAQLNKDFNYNGVITNQIIALSQAGYLNTNVTNVHTLRALAPLTNTAVSLEYRIRSYLAANCVQCHQPGGLAGANWDGRINTVTENAGLVNGSLVSNQGNTNNAVLVPGSLATSMMLTRISSPGNLRMPPLDSTVLDTNAINVLSAWITNDLPQYQTFAQWQVANFKATNAVGAGPAADPDGDGASNYLEYLTGTNPNLPADFWSIGIQRSNNVTQIVFPQIANRGFEVEATTNMNPSSWAPLNVPGNDPFFSVSNRVGVVNDPAAGTNKYYRVRVFQP